MACPEGSALRGGGRHAHQGRKVPGCLRLCEDLAGFPVALRGLGALLGACRKHYGDVQLVELPVQRFFRLQSGNAGKYVVLLNTYATHKMCYNVSNMHEVMNSLGMRKDRPAWSVMEVQGKKHTFWCLEGVDI
jgi:hypothetical protein